MNGKLKPTNSFQYWEEGEEGILGKGPDKLVKLSSMDSKGWEIPRGSGIFCMNEILNLSKRHLELMDMNKGIVRNEGYLKSLIEDKKVRKRGE